MVQQHLRAFRCEQQGSEHHGRQYVLASLEVGGIRVELSSQRGVQHRPTSSATKVAAARNTAGATCSGPCYNCARVLRDQFPSRRIDQHLFNWLCRIDGMLCEYANSTVDVIGARATATKPQRSIGLPLVSCACAGATARVNRSESRLRGRSRG
jgi:hypothetical protein